ncbi:hypothetical protein MNEG_12311 [Monoraphidium neglectum]|uniref:BACK domain-containing protein n=1 Tax=Monoraphidium neglectum TaxID=145388 RepID=A0A0D2MLG5_9CHLO|nr:hypothetical protein MNEG_12311 [Monoraphidium neglectum]KIY95650.1 hypothetical protein MNEG_12311 [Monoraphidium neglectum]|eukprot:XP_013894670.1 hypothetical protein MNEG_12311 [Monoraphidium neglectum]
MLRCAYSGAAPAGAAAEQLLACMVLADRYQLRHCVEACGRAIRALDGVRVSWPAALALLRLPPGLQEAAAFSSLAEKAYQRVRADFQNVDVAFQRARLRAAFLQLPRGAVEHLLRAQELCTVSENTVFLAAASWLRAREREAAVAAEEGGAGAEGGDALELLRLVRYPHMSANFLAAVAGHEQLLRRHPDFQTRPIADRPPHLARPRGPSCHPSGVADPRGGRLLPRARGSEGATSAFTSYIARDDLHTAISKYRASSCRDATS